MSSVLDSLNPVQREAAECTEGPLLILAGAGSGKTRVLTHRIAYLIDELQVNPWNILAITFTNKAAQEMRDRVDRLVMFGAESIWVATFHSTCVRILRRYIDRLGYEPGFTIYDTDDQKTLIRRIVKEMDLDPKQYREGAVLGYISSAKNELLDPDECERNAGSNYRERKQAEIYGEYQKRLIDNNAVDFDDLLLLTVKLFRDNSDVLDYYQQRFKYIMVDEYQDTNSVQFELIRQLSGKYRNLCVVGDDDQSIYKFRGANITNILSFEEVFRGARVIKLEQNYRSTTNILDAANEVIANNIRRKDKKLWSENGDGNKVVFQIYENGFDEAEGIVREIRDMVSSGEREYKDIAVLYRTNAQSRVLEEKCVAQSVPYRLIGGVNFYQRQEVKDILSYLKVIDSGRDDMSVLRVVNVPRRGIGQTTVNRLTEYAADNGLRLFQAMERAGEIPGMGKAADKVKAFVNQIMVLRALAHELDAAELIEKTLELTGYYEELDKLEEDKAQQKKENIEELINKAADYYSRTEEADLTGFLEEVALVADIDNLDRESDCLTLMTLHGAKGLEFPVVYISGMEEGLFPGYISINSDDPTDIEEERRLCYVGITRAKEKLTLTAARQRMVHGANQFNKISRFIDEIPEQLLDKRENGSGRTYGGTKTVRKADLHASVGKTYGKGFYSSPGIQGSDAKLSVPSYGKVFAMEKPDHLEYGTGDRVSHVKFGQGTVTGIEDTKKDYQVTVDFDNAGTKKMFAGFAKLVKVKT